MEYLVSIGGNQIRLQAENGLELELALTNWFQVAGGIGLMFSHDTQRTEQTSIFKDDEHTDITYIGYYEEYRGEW